MRRSSPVIAEDPFGVGGDGAFCRHVANGERGRGVEGVVGACSV